SQVLEQPLRRNHLLGRTKRIVACEVSNESVCHADDQHAPSGSPPCERSKIEDSKGLGPEPSAGRRTPSSKTSQSAPHTEASLLESQRPREDSSQSSPRTRHTRSSRTTTRAAEFRMLRG